MSILLKIPAYSHRVGLLHTNTCSGVQRLFDARGANEVLGCPRIFSIFLVVHQNFSNSSHKITDDLFSHLPKFFSNSQIFPFFASVFKFQENSLLGCPPVPHHTPVTTFFSSFLVIYLHFITKTGPLDAPWGGCPGPSHRPHPPLHATATSCLNPCSISVAAYLRDLTMPKTTHLSMQPGFRLVWVGAEPY